MKLKQLLFGFILVFLLTGCEQKNIDTEILRLQT
jgi:hypothetical protein